jgi:hypothetical protein
LGISHEVLQEQGIHGIEYRLQLGSNVRTDIDGSHYVGSGYSGVIDVKQMCADLDRRITEERLEYATVNGIDAH